MAVRTSVRFEVFKRDAFTCRYCGAQAPSAILEIDHVLPRCEGGGDEIENLVAACYQCNRGKSGRVLSEIPPEQNLHEKAIEIAERELQLRALTHWQRQAKQREDDAMAELEGQWAGSCASVMGKYVWRPASVRKFLRDLGPVQLEEIIEYVAENASNRNGNGIADASWRMFCGICWYRIKAAKGDGGGAG